MPSVTPAVTKRSVAPGRPPATLDAMAWLAKSTGWGVHVVLAREPGVVEHARDTARRLGVNVSVDVMPSSIRARFSSPLTNVD